MTNEEYQKSRGTDHPFTVTPAQADRIFAKLYPAEVKRAKARRKAAERFQGKQGMAWREFSVEDDD